MPVALLAVIGAVITFFALWPIWGGLVALAAAPFGGSFLAVLVLALVASRPYVQRCLDRYRSDGSSSENRSAPSKVSR